MAYFAASLAFFVAALALMGFGFGIPFPVIDAPDTLVVVHLIAVGWLGLLFSGALLQFVPVLAATHLRLPGLAVPALVAIAAGLSLLLAGFLVLGGHLDLDPAAMFVGGILLAIGFLFLITSFAATIVSQKSFAVSGSLVLAGLFALGVTAVMGVVFAGLLSGMVEAPFLSSLLPLAVPYHAASGTLGWMTLAAIGVSYRLFAMFMLSPETKGRDRSIFVLAASALAALYLSLVVVGLDERLSAATMALAIALALVLMVLYLRDVALMLKARRRRQLELNSLAGMAALVFLGVGMALLASSTLFGDHLPLGPTAFYILGLGWLSGLGLAQLYKIVPFLTWLETYGAVMGRSQVPRVQDLVDERGAKVWFVVYYLSVCLGGAAILLGWEPAFRAASWLQCGAVIVLSVEYVRARRLAYAPSHIRLPTGTVRPYLICAKPDSKE
ncbi:hypothetical protein JJB09_16215 [Rhizobium sp. KVB221]|uniref:Uncharacterized protein n=1 Tax=Rhizobium setariae TaxID=2801340 RepID=A0A936YUZ3_9HYPH|nr:hypothetical protein [Rhizobium setariae]MBL0373572.1 hypothetical protein [Rhizobium setariae]